jgi:hypothetical protein
VDTLRAVALRTLDGVGDATLGQWEERGRLALHVRRRLTIDEARRIDGVKDIRGTPDALKRFERMRPHLPPGWTEIM